MTLHRQDSQFDACAAPDDGPVYPLFYICEVEAGVCCSKDGRLLFVEDRKGFGTVSLFVHLVQDDEDADIEIRAISWGSEASSQELEGAVFNAAEEFVRLDWSGVEAAFQDKAATDWQRILGKGYRRFLRQAEAAA